MSSQLGPAHYKLLLRLNSHDQRNFYIPKTIKKIGQRELLRLVGRAFENATIGIMLCAGKNNAIVKITLPEHNQTVNASEYKLYLRSEQQLWMK